MLLLVLFYHYKTNKNTTKFVNGAVEAHPRQRQEEEEASLKDDDEEEASLKPKGKVSIHRT